MPVAFGRPGITGGVASRAIALSRDTATAYVVALMFDRGADATYDFVGDLDGPSDPKGEAGVVLPPAYFPALLARFVYC